MSSGIPAQERTGFKEVLVLATCILALGGILTSINTLRLALYIVSDDSASSIFVLAFWLIISLFTLAFGALTSYTIERVSRPPPNSPSEFIADFCSNKKKRPTLVCLGDSLTHGACSANFVSRIPNVLREKQNVPDNILNVVNAGQNTICTWTILQERVLHALACDPDYICLLIGTNDIRTTYKKEWAEDMIRIWELPEQPSFEVYERNLTNIVAQLVHSKTNAHIGICTLPPMGEDLSCKANQCVKQANEIVRNVGRRFECTGKVEVLDLFHALEMGIQKLPAVAGWDGKHHSIDDFESAAIWMNVGHYILGKSWSSMSEKIGNKVLSDSLHLNELGRDFVVDVVVEWLIRCGVPPNT